MAETDRIAANTKRAAAALRSLKKASTPDEQLAAAKALESSACQLRRALTPAAVKSGRKAAAK